MAQSVSMGKKKDAKAHPSKKAKKAGKSAKDSAGSSLVEVPAKAVKAVKPSTAVKRTTGVAARLTFDKATTVLADVPSGVLPFGPQDKDQALGELEHIGRVLATEQEKLYAESTVGGRRSVLLLLQGMDTAGKDGVIKHVLGLLNPGGMHIASFKKPSDEERAHDFLWRIERQLPAVGQIGVFNRSQYEDVLVVRVHELVPRSQWASRYAQINAFERAAARRGISVIKCFLHVSKKVQRERLAARLEDPTKYWKYNPQDVDERELWDGYQAAYLDALRRCSTVGAPWHVIPADEKWYRNWAVAALLAEKLQDLNLQYPPPDFDLFAERRRVAES